VVDLRWEQVDLKTTTLHVRGVKNGTPPVFSPYWSEPASWPIWASSCIAHMLRHSTGYNDALMMLRLNMAGPPR
jgi:hypothetical protein